MGPTVASRQAAARSALLPAVVCGVAGLLIFQLFGNSTRGYIDTASLFHWWVSQWLNPASESEHGWLILGLSVWLGWRNYAAATRAAETPAEASVWRGVVAMAGGLMVHAGGFAAQQARLSILGLLLFTWGAIDFGGGRRMGDAARFPIAFLVFAIPINVLDSLGFWLRMWVIEASAALAQGAGIGVLRSGTQLVAPDGRYHYDVAAACSGVRSLTALVALSLLVGYLNFRSWRRRALVLLLCFPLVYLGNVARITAIIFAAQLGGPAWGDRIHELMGFGVFVIVLGGVLAVVTLMQRRWPEGKPVNREGWAGREENKAGTWQLSGWSFAGIVAGVALVEGAFLHHLANVPERGAAGVALATDGLNPVELPAFIGTEWIGRRAEVTPIEREILPPDTGYSRKVYVSLGTPKREVLLSLVLSGRDRSSIHRPELCLVGQGWTIDGARQHRFASPGGGKFPATVLQIQREVAGPRGPVRVPQLAVYWFVDSEAVVATHWERLARDAWNRLTRARADRWAYVLLQTDATDGTEAALQRMQHVLDATLPSFLRVPTGT
jgi:exosortase